MQKFLVRSGTFSRCSCLVNRSSGWWDVDGRMPRPLVRSVVESLKPGSKGPSSIDDGDPHPYNALELKAKSEPTEILLGRSEWKEGSGETKPQDDPPLGLADSDVL